VQDELDYSLAGLDPTHGSLVALAYKTSSVRNAPEISFPRNLKSQAAISSNGTALANLETCVSFKSPF
jgi:hypothetical protein